MGRYIDNKLYWVLHAARQTGKTTFLMSWIKNINASGQAVACYVSVERCQEVPEPERAIPAIFDAIRYYANNLLGPSQAPPLSTVEPLLALSQIMSDWAKLVAPKPLVVLFDEVEVLRDQALVSFCASFAEVFRPEVWARFRCRGLGGHVRLPDSIERRRRRIKS